MPPVLARKGRLVVGLVAALALVLVPAASASALSPSATQTWGTNGRVSALLPVGGKVVVAGDFSAVVNPRGGSSVSAANLALFDPAAGSFVTTWLGSTDGPVTALATDGTNLYVGGSFRTVGGASHRNLAAVSLSTGAVVSGWTAQTSGAVSGLAVAFGSVFVGGNFVRVTDGGGTASGPYLARLSTTSGAVVSGTPAPNAAVRAFALSSSGADLYVGGDFTSIGGGSPRIARLRQSGSTLAVDRTFRAGPTNGSSRAPVISLAMSPTQLLVAAGGGGGGCAGLSLTNGATQWSKKANGNVQAVAYLAGTAYCGGHFSGTGSFDGQRRMKIAAVDVSTRQTTSYAPRVNSALGVWALATDGTRLFVGGDFTRFGGNANQPHFAVVI